MGDKAQKRKVKFQVLIVEDDKCTAGIVADILREKGLDCYVSNNGVEGLDFLDTLEFDALITDLHMPEMGGKEMLENLKPRFENNDKKPLVVVASGYEQMIDELGDLNADYIYRKPLDLDHLAKTVADECVKREKN